MSDVRAGDAALMRGRNGVAGPLSLWDANAGEPDVQAPFAADGERVDIAVVGGGFTGLACALRAAERGLRSHVLEARRIGHGGSGRNVGLVNAGVWLPPSRVMAVLGEARGARFLAMFGDGPRRVFELIEAHRIRCNAVRNGTIHAAHAPSGCADLERRHAAWRHLGADVELLARDRVADLVGSGVFHGGLLDHRAGTINPMGFCRGLARAARAAGAEISTGTTVRLLHRDGADWRLETDRGVLRAGCVMLCTNAYTDALYAGLQGVFTGIDYFQLATLPLGPRAAHILPQGQGLWDTGRIMVSLRRDGQGRLVIGSMGRIHGTAERGLSQRWARKQIARLFPDLGPLTFEAAWHGRIALTTDHLPRILKLDDRLFAPIGYNGRGITTGVIMGQAMAELAAEAEGAEAELPLSVTGLRRAWGGGMAARLFALAFAANQLIKSI